MMRKKGPLDRIEGKRSTKREGMKNQLEKSHKNHNNNNRLRLIQVRPSRKKVKDIPRDNEKGDTIREANA